jgi:hypothetical protein
MDNEYAWWFAVVFGAPNWDTMFQLGGTGITITHTPPPMKRGS